MGGKTKFLLPTVVDGYSTESLALAVQQMARLAKSNQTVDLPEEDIVVLTERLVMHPEDGPLDELLTLARTVPNLDAWLIDTVFPGVAAKLGDGWMYDSLSFVDVTIAATRLQDSIRRLGRINLPPRGSDALAIVVPPWEQHTLPAMLLADRLRRLGVPTRVLNVPTVQETLFLIGRTNPSALLLSCGSSGSLVRIGELISLVRQQVARPMPIVLGGPVLSYDLERAKTLGADNVTSDTTKALSFCGFSLDPS